MKQRFSSLDVRVIAHELSNSLVSLRLSNIYDLSSRIFLLKFAKPDRREQLIVDSGFRCHLTSFARSTAAAPSPFITRLRKYLRTRRVTKISQIGTDRVIEIQFSDGSYRLFLEFYAGGNIILTDGDLSILGLLRNVTEGAEEEHFRVGSKYDLTLRQNYDGVPPLTKERIRDGLKKAIERQKAEAEKPGKKLKRKAGDTLRKALAITTTEFPPILIDHALYVTKFNRETLPEQVVEDEGTLDSLLRSLQEAQRVIQEITSEETARGYILATRKKPSPSNDQTSHAGLLYDDFQPFKPAHLGANVDTEFIEHAGFNKTVDEFFSSIEGQKLESRLNEREENAKRKITQARQEQEQRIGGLQQVQEMNVRKAQAIEANVERVEEAVAAVNGLIAQGMDWVDIGRLIENEKARGNAVAEMIKLPLKLHENTVTLLLSEIDTVAIDEDLAEETDSDVSDSDDEAVDAQPTSRTNVTRLAIDIDLAASAWSNAREYYDQKRSAAVKQERTVLASEKALKSTERKVMADLQKGLKTEKDILRPVRKAFWFEKFIYFISSDGYLVLAGKDAQQNEILYKRYLKKGDVYLHADLHGAASVVIKNNSADSSAPIPPSTLSQAGNLAVCTSNAWDSKAGMSAWWVNADQVSKTAPTGEYLSTGGFVIRGKKNFLPPAQLLLGFAITFQISEESKARHVKHRVRDEDVTSTARESAKSGDDKDEGDDDDDDDFPDAPAGKIDTDEDDDFPDADAGQVTDVSNDGQQKGATSDDAVPKEATHNGNDGDQDASEDDVSDEEDEKGQRDPHRQNPLQSGNHVHEDEDAGTSEEEEDEPASTNGAQTSIKDEEHPAGLSAPKQGDQLQTTNPQKPHVRGKRGKAKKAAKKYAEQDEEEREIAMQLLGSRADAKKEAEAAAREAKVETQEEARARRRAQHERQQKAGLEAEEIRRLNLEEGIETVDDEEAANLTELDALVGIPLPGDEILEAIPVCAPWSALTKYKYKVKLQPGQQKKGKAVREIMGRWQKDAGDGKKLDQHSQDTERIWPREAELIKGLKEAEVVGIIPVKSVRVMMSGGAGDKAKAGKGAKGGGRGGRGSKKSR